VPYSGLVLENDEPEPTTQAEDLALLESLPKISGKRSAEPPAPTLLAHAGPIAASTSGQAAATALAPEKKVLDFRTAGAAPMVTNEAIVPTTESAEPFNTEPYAAPTFSSLEGISSQSTGGGRFLKMVVVLALVAGGGYFASRQPVVQKLLHRGTAAQATPATDTSDETGAAQPVTIQPPIDTMQSATDSQNSAESPASTPAVRAQSPVQTPSRSVSQKSTPPEDIEVQELPIARDAGKTTVAPKPQQPIVVKNDTAMEKPAQPAAPPVNLISNGDAAKLPSLVPADVELPKPAPGTIRISQGVSQGLLMRKVQPVYPPLARQFQKQGTVQLLATITKYGDVSKVQVLGGDPLLAKAAVDAVKQWQYRPYLLNGLPVEIETQISIIFKEK
jgi:protein TonB